MSIKLQENFEKSFLNFHGEILNRNYFNYYYEFPKEKDDDVDVDFDYDDVFQIQIKIEERFYDLGKLFGYEKTFLLMNIKQVALSEKYQKQGYFRSVMKFIENYCESKGINLLVSQILNPKLAMTLKKNNFTIVIDDNIIKEDDIKEEDLKNMMNVNAVKIFSKKRKLDDAVKIFSKKRKTR